MHEYTHVNYTCTYENPNKHKLKPQHKINKHIRIKLFANFQQMDV